MLRRTPLKSGSSTLKRTAFKTPTTSSGILRIAAVERERKTKALKTSRPKMTPIRRAARGQDCTMRFAICNRNPETTVWAHSNNYCDGKGAGKKARDEEGCFSCSSCHSFYDGGYANAGWTREAVEAQFDIARTRSQEILKQKGLIQ